MAVSGTSWTLLANGSVRSSPMLSTARKTSPISVDPIGVARPRDSTSAIGSSTQNTRVKRFGKNRKPLGSGVFLIRSMPPCALALRSEEHTSELQSLMRISYDVFCLKKTNTHIPHTDKDLISANQT